MRSIRTRLWTSHPQVGILTDHMIQIPNNIYRMFQIFKFKFYNIYRLFQNINSNFTFPQLEREGYRVALIDNVHSDIARCVKGDLFLCLFV